MNGQRKDQIHLKKTPLKKPPKQLQTHNVPTYEVEHTSGTNKEINLFLAYKPPIAPRGTEKMPQRIQKHRSTTIHWSAHPQRELDES